MIFKILLFLLLVCLTSAKPFDSINSYALLWPDDDVTYATTKASTSIITTITSTTTKPWTNVSQLITDSTVKPSTRDKSHLINIICNSCENIVITNNIL